MSQVRRSFQRPINSGVVIPRDLYRGLRIAVSREIVALGIVPMAKGDLSPEPALDENFPDSTGRDLQPIIDRISPRRGRRLLVHLKACPMREATRSSTSRSSFLNALSVSHSAAITPTTRSELLMIGTTISDRVVWKVGR